MELIRPAAIPVFHQRQPRPCRPYSPGHADIPDPSLLHNVVQRLHLEAVQPLIAVIRSAVSYSPSPRSVSRNRSYDQYISTSSLTSKECSPVALQHVDVFDLQSLETGLYAVKDVFPAQTLGVREARGDSFILADGVVHLRVGERVQIHISGMKSPWSG